MRIFLQAFLLFVILTVLTGVLYPLAVTRLAVFLFPSRAQGSLLEREGRVVGSELLAQKFEDPRYFWPRPSAADYGAVASGASNQGPTNAALQETHRERAEAFRKVHGLAAAAAVPAEMISASGSGLDPHITPGAARLQIARIAAARKFDERGRQRLEALVEKHTEYPVLGILGKPRVNVLKLNLELDSL